MASTPEPSAAVRARHLVQARGFGVLATAFHRQAGHPYGSTVPFVADAQGRPVFLFSHLAVHFRNVEQDSRSSLVVFAREIETDPLDCDRVTLIGRTVPVPDLEVVAARASYLDRFPAAAEYIELSFYLFRFEIEAIHWIGGFGGASWPAVSDYSAPPP